MADEPTAEAPKAEEPKAEEPKAEEAKTDEPKAAAEAGSGKTMALASALLGLISMFAWLCPIAGAPISIVGLLLGIKATAGEKKAIAVAGMVMSILGLIAAVTYGYVAAKIFGGCGGCGGACTCGG